MPVSMHQISLPVFIRHLNGLAGCMKKAQADYAEKKYDEATLLNYRFYPDMFNFTQQIQATDHPGTSPRCWPEWKRRSSRTTKRASPTSSRAWRRRSLSQVGQAGADRRHRGEGVTVKMRDRRRALQGTGAAAEPRPAQLQLPRHDRLRHPAAQRRGARQARLHGEADQRDSRSLKIPYRDGGPLVAVVMAGESLAESERVGVESQR